MEASCTVMPLLMQVCACCLEIPFSCALLMHSDVRLFFSPPVRQLEYMDTEARLMDLGA